MKKTEKKRLLKKWMKRFGICYVTIDVSSDKDGYCVFDFLDKTATSWAGFCYGGIHNLVAFPFSYEEMQKWHPHLSASDSHVLSFIVDCLDNKKSWAFEDGTVFFSTMYHSRFAIDLVGFSWETMTINLDLTDEEFYAKEN